ncbi:MAG: hypothetical protein GY941_14095 [Planctomycetes bacterium]|nr:hypothetical protein [Planctomycetota bacterium]
MKTFPIKDETGNQIGFEIENAYIGVNKIVNLLSTITSVSNIKRRKLFDFKDENHIEFKFLGFDCIVWEPYGDNSRYWIGPKEEKKKKVDILVIENTFKTYIPPFYVKFIGCMISLNFKNIFKRNE